MTDTTDDQQTHDDRITALQAVVDRVGSWQDGATEGTVAEELRHGIAEAGVTASDDEVARLADAIQDDHGHVNVAETLG